MEEVSGKFWRKNLDINRGRVMEIHGGTIWRVMEGQSGESRWKYLEIPGGRIWTFVEGESRGFWRDNLEIPGGNT